MGDYWPRVIDTRVVEQLGSLGGVLIDGPRASGKSETSSKHAASNTRLDVSPQLRELAQVAPEKVLEGETPRAIDEWQLAPQLWNVARALIDSRKEPGQFIFTGSAVPADDVTRHSGVGRFGRLLLRPMSLWESRDSTGEVALAELFKGINPAGLGGPTVSEYASLSARGGWPALVTAPKVNSRVYLDAYLDGIARAELLSDSRRADPIRMLNLLRALACNVSTEVSQAKLAAEAGINVKTVSEYLDTLTRLFVLEPQPAWSPRLRSSVRMRVKSKWHLVDPSLAVRLLNASADRLLDDLETFGFIFESLCIRDLRVYAEPLGGDVFHYRDETGLEVDAVVQLPDGTWAAFEVKLGGEQAIDRAANNLLALAEKVDDKHRERLRSLVILTGGNTSYPRADGTHVVSLGHLRP